MAELGDIMGRIATTLGALAVTLGLALAPAPAQADEWGPWNITDPQNVCVHPTYGVAGSGWQLYKAVHNWNSVQSDVHFVVSYDPSCNDVLVHRYFAADGNCGYAHHQRLWDQAYQENGVVYVTGGDVYLNDNCSTSKRTRKWVMAHELGHIIGLIHGTGDDSVMSPTYNAYLYRGVPGPTDVANVDALYSQPSPGQ